MSNQPSTAGQETTSSGNSIALASTTNMNSVSSDLVGAFASLLCTLHCIATPLLFAAAPMLLESAEAGSESENGVWSSLWGSLDMVFLGLSAWAVWVAVRNVASRNVQTVFIFAFLLFSAGLLGERFGFEHTGVLTYTGSAMLIIAHSYRLRSLFGGSKNA